MARVKVTIEVPEKQLTKVATIDTDANPDEVAAEMANNLNMQGTYILRPKGTFTIKEGSVLELIPQEKLPGWSWE